MNKIVKTASLVTSGIIVGALVRKFAFQGISMNKKSTLESIKSVKDLFDKNNISEDVNNYFV
jgi:hypothetical protein